MKLSDYLTQAENIQNKTLVYKEVRDYLEKYIQTDTREPEMYIPTGTPSFDGEEVVYDKYVPQHVIADVALEIEDAMLQINKELQKLLDKEI